MEKNVKPDFCEKRYIFLLPECVLVSDYDFSCPMNTVHDSFIMSVNNDRFLEEGSSFLVAKRSQNCVTSSIHTSIEIFSVNLL